MIIWDEVLVSSRQIFELVNASHDNLSENTYAFGGIQVILVGDFLQLTPVKSLVYKEEPVYKSQLFDAVFPHRIELKKILRQDDSESELRNALDQPMGRKV